MSAAPPPFLLLSPFSNLVILGGCCTVWSYGSGKTAASSAAARVFNARCLPWIVDAGRTHQSCSTVPTYLFGYVPAW
ncbi:hypothetical protein LX36DRAFT_182367 [Colletotrichum falcatum]|nr:hypothetical protein LX36DRAFT_182367 [Colletotrichum falcatum]